MIRPVSEWTMLTDQDIATRKLIGKTSIYIMEVQLVEDGSNLTEIITDYYNSKGIATKIKYCPLKKAYEIAIWWD